MTMMWIVKTMSAGAAGTALFLAASAGSAFQGEPSGFRGIVWGTPYEQVKNLLSNSADSGDVRCYGRPGDKMQFGDARLKALAYCFYKGRFSGAVAQSIDGDEPAMIRVFLAQFGDDAVKPNQFMENRSWLGGTTDISLDCNEIRNSCDGTLVSKALREEQSRDQDTKAANAAGDF